MKTELKRKIGNKLMLISTLNLLIWKSFLLNGQQNVKVKIKTILKSILQMFLNNSKVLESTFSCTPLRFQHRTFHSTKPKLTTIINNLILQNQLQFLKRSSLLLKKEQIFSKRRRKCKQAQFKISNTCKEII